MRLIDFFWKWPDGLVWRTTRQATERSRRARFDLFMRVMKPKGTDLVLDVGAGEGEGRTVNFFEAWYPHRAQVTAVALGDLPVFRAAFPETALVIADGRDLPFEDGSFDLYFSNAVLEHVGTTKQQAKFVSEACRVAKRVFLSTPNRWFPVDAHTMIPFAHWLPMSARNWVYRLFGRTYFASEAALHLVGLNDIRRMLPKGIEMRVHPQRFFGLVSNWNVELFRR